MDKIKQGIKKYYSKLFLLEMYNFFGEYGFEESKDFGLIHLTPDIDLYTNGISLKLELTAFDKITEQIASGTDVSFVTHYLMEVMFDYIAPRLKERGLDNISFTILIYHEKSFLDSYRFTENALKVVHVDPTKLLCDQIAKPNFFHYFFNNDFFNPRRSGRSQRDIFYILLDFLVNPMNFYCGGSYNIDFKYNHEVNMLLEIYNKSELFIEYHDKYQIFKNGLKSVIIDDINPNVIIPEESVLKIIIEFLSSKDIIYA